MREIGHEREESGPMRFHHASSPPGLWPISTIIQESSSDVYYFIRNRMDNVPTVGRSNMDPTSSNASLVHGPVQGDIFQLLYTYRPIFLLGVHDMAAAAESLHFRSHLRPPNPGHY